MAEMTLGQDASFTEQGFVRRYNADLANDLGNLLSRVLKLIVSHCDAAIPAPGEPGAEERELRELALAAARGLVDAVENMRLDAGLGALAGVMRGTNRYLERRQPWTLGKQGRQAELGTVLYSAAEALRIVSGMLYPVMPGKMGELRSALGLPAGPPNFGALSEWGGLKPGTAVSRSSSLFPRIQEKGKARAAAAKPPRPDTPVGVAQVEYADFAKLDLRTATVLSAEAVAGADKLLHLEIEIGAEKRRIVAGIAQHYAPGELAGKTIVVVSNLKPARIRGIVSQGMLLAAKQGDQLRLVTIDGDLPGGAEVS